MFYYGGFHTHILVNQKEKKKSNTLVVVAKITKQNSHISGWCHLPALRQNTTQKYQPLCSQSTHTKQEKHTQTRHTHIRKTHKEAYTCTQHIQIHVHMHVHVNSRKLYNTNASKQYQQHKQ